VLEASALLPDISTFPAGVDTEIGEKGINLSGGQRARISFARTLYRDADITFLDDPLSAVDSHTCEHLWSKGVKKFLREGYSSSREKTVLIITHQVHLLNDCDLLVILDDNGSVKKTCKYNDLSKAELNDLFHENEAEKANDAIGSADRYSDSSISSVRGRSVTVESKKDDTIKDDNSKLLQDEDRKTGIVPFSVYLWFCKASNYSSSIPRIFIL